jgi:hypothetical protein
MSDEITVLNPGPDAPLVCAARAWDRAAELTAGVTPPPDFSWVHDVLVPVESFSEAAIRKRFGLP